MINFSGNENLSNLIDLEKVSLMSTLDIQKSFNKQILIFVKKFMANVNFSVDSNPNDETFFYLTEATNTLNKSNSNISILKDLINDLEQLVITNENLNEKIKSYNNKFKENMNCIYTNTSSIEKFVYEITVNDFSDSSNISHEQITENSPVSIPISTVSSSDDSSTKNDIKSTLVISETQKKVILPYDINTVENILQNNSKKYSSVEDVINNLYTKPISYYKFSSLARFKEAYKLVKEREKGSRLKALSLAFELLGNYSLHPAIITACSSLDELDIYLACLEENALDDFHFFNIKYDVPLSISKLAKNNI